MAWDDRDGKDFMVHFHSCWFTSCLVKLYEPSMLVFLCNDLVVVDNCFPPEAAIRKGQHQVVHIQRGSKTQTTIGQELADDEFEGEARNLFHQYRIVDDPDLVEAVPTLQSMGRSEQRRPPKGGEKEAEKGLNSIKVWKLWRPRA